MIQSSSWFHRDNQAAGMFTRRVREESPALSAQSGPAAGYRRSGAGDVPDRERPVTPAAVPIALGDGALRRSELVVVSSMNSVGS